MLKTQAIKVLSAYTNKLLRGQLDKKPGERFLNSVIVVIAITNI